MDANGSSKEPTASKEEVRAIWNANAAWWDEVTGPDGNDFQQLLIGPATERLLALRPGETVLDIACGNGAFARRLAALGARAVAFDFSEVFIDRARAHTADHADRIEYRVLDATDEAALLALGPGRFDAAVCTMALMDMATIDPLARTLTQLLTPVGRFVFSVTHPCFNSTGAPRMEEEELRDGLLVTRFAVKVTEYLHTPPRKGVGIIGQPASQYYFDRPLHVLFGTFFRHGFVLDGLEEPAHAPGSERKGIYWRNFTEIPPVLVARLRLSGTP